MELLLFLLFGFASGPSLDLRLQHCMNGMPKMKKENTKAKRAGACMLIILCIDTYSFSSI